MDSGSRFYDLIFEMEELMLQEIISFTKGLVEKSPEYLTKGLRPSDGLHVLIALDGNGKLPLEEDGVTPCKDFFITYVIDKKSLPQEEWEQISQFEYYSSWFDSNKWLDTTKKIHSTIPYALWFKKGSVDDPKKGLPLVDSFPIFFKTALTIGEITEDEKNLIKQIEDFCTDSLLDFLRVNDDYKKIKGREKDNAGDDVKIYFSHIPLENMILAKERYLSKKLFSKDDYNLKIDGEVVGLSGFMNGLSDRKEFLKHKTTAFEVNTRIAEENTAVLYQFEKLLKAKPRKLPNPLPIFIDKNELNNDILNIYDEDGTIGTGEMFRAILNIHEAEFSDLGSYLLLNWANTKDGLVFRDVDYVANFRLKFNTPLEVKVIIRDDHAQQFVCTTILDFEHIIVQKIFSNTLITKTKEGHFIRKYFEEISTEYCTATTYQNVLRYRKPFYDFIYKSRSEAISSRSWFDILWSEIREAIRQDKDFNKQFVIRELFDILFSLNSFFDSTNSNFGGQSMPSLIPALQDKVREVIHSKGATHIETDEEFCFAAGQLMYMIVNANQSGNKSHSLIESYISKSQPEQFKLALANGLARYAHAFEVIANGKGRTESLAAEVFGYATEVNLKEMLPIILAGYFSQSLVFEKGANSQSPE